MSEFAMRLTAALCTDITGELIAGSTSYIEACKAFTDVNPHLMKLESLVGEMTTEAGTAMADSIAGSAKTFDDLGAAFGESHDTQADIQARLRDLETRRAALKRISDSSQTTESTKAWSDNESVIKDTISILKANPSTPSTLPRHGDQDSTDSL